MTRCFIVMGIFSISGDWWRADPSRVWLHFKLFWREQSWSAQNMREAEVGEIFLLVLESWSKTFGFIFLLHAFQKLQFLDSFSTIILVRDLGSVAGVNLIKILTFLLHSNWFIIDIFSRILQKCCFSAKWWCSTPQCPPKVFMGLFFSQVF